MIALYEQLIMTFTAKGETVVTLRPVQKSDAYEIIESVTHCFKIAQKGKNLPF